MITGRFGRKRRKNHQARILGHQVALTGSKNRKGHYSLLNIDAEHGAIAEMERRISLNDDIIDS